MPDQHQRPGFSAQQLCDGTDFVPGAQSGEGHDASFWFEVFSQDGCRLGGATLATVADLKDLNACAAG
jgi:hypothetical protein